MCVCSSLGLGDFFSFYLCPTKGTILQLVDKLKKKKKMVAVTPMFHIRYRVLSSSCSTGFQLSASADLGGSRWHR